MTTGQMKVRDLRPRVGDLRQSASVRRIALDDGAERGVRALAFSTGGGLDFLGAGRPLARYRAAVVEGGAGRVAKPGRVPQPRAARRRGRWRPRFRPQLFRVSRHRRARPYPPTGKRPAAAWPPAVFAGAGHSLWRGLGTRRAVLRGRGDAGAAWRRGAAIDAPDRGADRRDQFHGSRHGRERRADAMASGEPLPFQPRLSGGRRRHDRRGRWREGARAAQGAGRGDGVGEHLSPE